MNKKIVYTYRYSWILEGSESINFKIVSDVEEGLLSFEKALFKLPNLCSVGKEYLHEYDSSKIGFFEKIFDKVGEKNEAR